MKKLLAIALVTSISLPLMAAETAPAKAPTTAAVGSSNASRDYTSADCQTSTNGYATCDWRRQGQA